MENLQYVYDVQLNWADGMLKSYCIPKYHEWYKDDAVEVYTSMPIILVSEELFTYIEEEYDVLPDEILEAVFEQSTAKVDGVSEYIPYAFVLTDGKRMLAVDTDDEDVPNFKSYLTPRTMEYVEAKMFKLSPIATDWKKPEPLKLSKKDQLSADLLLLDEQYVKGLTRAERDMKSILMTYLFTLTTSTNPVEVRYWYSEVFPGTFNDEKVKRMRTETLVRKMFDELKEGWDDRHVSLGDDFIKSNTLFKTAWTALKKRQKEKVEK